MNMTEQERMQALAELENCIEKLKALGTIKLSTEQHLDMTDAMGHLITAKAILIGRKIEPIYLTKPQS